MSMEVISGLLAGKKFGSPLIIQALGKFSCGGAVLSPSLPSFSSSLLLWGPVSFDLFANDD
jgi:hypothetical protein